MEQYALRQKIPIVGPAVGRTLYLLAQISGARRIFEMGSAIGYSTVWLARAAGPGAEIFYTDGDPANAARARGYLRRAKLERRVKILVGDAVELIDSIGGQFDLDFYRCGEATIPGGLQKIPSPSEEKGASCCR